MTSPLLSAMNCESSKGCAGEVLDVVHTQNCELSQERAREVCMHENFIGLRSLYANVSRRSRRRRFKNFRACAYVEGEIERGFRMEMCKTQPCESICRKANEFFITHRRSSLGFFVKNPHPVCFRLKAHHSASFRRKLQPLSS